MSINLSATTPPAPGGNTNVTWQADGEGNISGYTPTPTGTVTSFSSGNLSPLFTTSVATPTTTPALSFILSNAAAGTVLNNATASAAAPTYTAALLLGASGTIGTVSLKGNTSGTVLITPQAAAGTPTLTLPSATGTFAVSASAPLAVSATTGNITIDQTTTTLLWNNLQNATGALTLANAGNATTFNQTSAVNWTWANTTNATSGTAQSSPIFNISGQYWNGSASATDNWTIQNKVSNGTNGQPILTFDHTGSSGINKIQFFSGATGQVQVGGAAIILNAGNGAVSATSVTGSSSVGTGSTGYFQWGSNAYIQGVSSGVLAVFDIAGTSFGRLNFGGNTSSFPSIKRNSAALDFRVADDSAYASINFLKVATYNAIATVSGGVPAEYATVDLTAQSAAIAATTLYAVPAAGAGMYRISWCATVTTAASTSSVLGGTNGFQVLYTDKDDSVVKTSPRTATTGVDTDSTNTTATAISSSVIVYAKASTNIQYQMDYNSVGVTGMQYNLHIKCEAL